jgi:hypothetical protein
VQVESDSQNLIKAIQGKEFDLAPEGVLYRDIRAFISLNFSSVVFSFTPRECNKVAHALAAFGASQRGSRLVWPEDLPNSVRVLTASDLAESLI